MNKKGFTLIETLAVITILSIIGVIIVLKVGESVSTAKNSLSDEQVNTIINATKKYVTENPDLLPEMEDSNDSMVTIDELIENGVIENDKVIDPKTKEQINGCILITYNQDNNQYEYEYESSIEICNIVEGTEYTFDYTGDVQEYTILRTGYYKLETWGAVGGTVKSTNISMVYPGGYGGYSNGIIRLKKGTKIYIYVGGQGTFREGNSILVPGGYNGGGDAYTSPELYRYASSGGGATHIATQFGLLSTLETKKNSILIVAGGGGGAWSSHSTEWATIGSGGSAGGFKGNGASAYLNSVLITATGGTQTDGYAFGTGGRDTHVETAGSGGGYYGGDVVKYAAGGGSGYIGNESLTNKSMYCYDCEESNGESTKTISTTGTSTERDTINCPNGYSESPISKCAKLGNGYAKIKYIGKIRKIKSNETNFAYTGTEQEYTAPKSGYYNLEVWGAQGGDADEEQKGGYGGYSSGIVKLNENEKIYINVGGRGTESSSINQIAPGGYNGGGDSVNKTSACGYFKTGSGGGATHIALSSGTLNDFDKNENGIADSNEIKNILIVAGGGGGSTYCNEPNYGSGGHAGGYIGGEAYNLGTDVINANGHGTGGTQDSPGCIYRSSGQTNCSSFGKSYSLTTSSIIGGGGGFYAGGAGVLGSGGGGSGYIGNTNLKNKIMFCYGCNESNSTSTKTISTTGTSEERDTTSCPNGYSETPISKCAKAGNGFARITYIGKILK